MNSKRRWSVVMLITLGFLIVGGLSACDEGAMSDKSAPSLSPSESERVVNLPEDLVLADISTAAASQSQRMIIKNGELSLRVQDTDGAFTQVTDTAARYGGYVIRSESDRSGDFDQATLTIAVESAHFDTAMSDLRQIGLEVLRDATSGEDVTTEYVDLESRLRNLEATRDRVLTFLDQAQNAEEAVLVNQQLTQIEGDIEQIKGRMNYLEGRVAFSTITVSLQEKAPEKDTSENWSARHIVDTAIEAQRDLVKLLFALLIWTVVVLGPYLLVVGLIVLTWRRYRRRTPPPVPPSDAGESQ